MPIKIYRCDADHLQENAWLCDGIWRLPEQIEVLGQWLETVGIGLPVGDYVADIGFAPRADAAGGGSVLSPVHMGIMARIWMSLFLSEYPLLESEEDGNGHDFA